MLPNFYYHPRMLAYDFGPQHPLKPERLRRTIQLAEALGIECIDPGEGDIADVLRIHTKEYVDAVKAISDGQAEFKFGMKYGFDRGDNPSFLGMYEASLAYCAGSAAAARAVRDGAPLAFNVSGGLHHARPDRANGFCIFNDCAIACHILRERFERVAYIDIDVHAGEGVMLIFQNDPSILTCSIHQDPATLFPGLGFIEDPGINVPLAPNTSADVWHWAFREGIIPFVEEFKPEAIVLQMGTDSHTTDPLARIDNDVSHWLAAVADVRDLQVPIVALGGGGYEVQNVPRMWVAACLTLAGREVPERLPEDLGAAWRTPTFRDQYQIPTARRGQAESMIDELKTTIGKVNL